MTKIEEAASRFSEEGLLLGNYHYDVESDPSPEGELTYIYLTRYKEECSGCKHWNNCYGEDPGDHCQAGNMKPVEPYGDIYSLVYYEHLNVLEDLDGWELDELTDMDKLAILLAAGCTEDERAYDCIFNGKDK